jgi:hypothetical protein
MLPGSNNESRHAWYARHGHANDGRGQAPSHDPSGELREHVQCNCIAAASHISTPEQRQHFLTASFSHEHGKMHDDV